MRGRGLSSPSTVGGLHRLLAHGKFSAARYVEATYAAKIPPFLDHALATRTVIYGGLRPAAFLVALLNPTHRFLARMRIKPEKPPILVNECHWIARVCDLKRKGPENATRGRKVDKVSARPLNRLHRVNFENSLMHKCNNHPLSQSRLIALTGVHVSL